MFDKSFCIGAVNEGNAATTFLNEVYNETRGYNFEELASQLEGVGNEAQFVELSEDLADVLKDSFDSNVTPNDFSLFAYDAIMTIREIIERTPGYEIPRKLFIILKLFQSVRRKQIHARRF